MPPARPSSQPSTAERKPIRNSAERANSPGSRKQQTDNEKRRTAIWLARLLGDQKFRLCLRRHANRQKLSIFHGLIFNGYSRALSDLALHFRVFVNDEIHRFVFASGYLKRKCTSAAPDRRNFAGNGLNRFLLRLLSGLRLVRRRLHCAQQQHSRQRHSTNCITKN